MITSVTWVATLPAILTMRNDACVEENNWLGATYECDFVRAADGWKIKQLELDIEKIVPYHPNDGEGGPL